MKTMNLVQARMKAERMVGELEMFCARHQGKPMIEIAGSIRRGRPFVNDIDLVVCCIAPIAFRERVARNCEIVTNGEQNLIARFPCRWPIEKQTQLDIFFARPEQRDLLETRPSNFASLLLCRTGSKEHNVWLACRALEMGGQWKPYEGLTMGGRLLATESEQDIYEALELPFIEPKEREIELLRRFETGIETVKSLS